MNIFNKLKVGTKIIFGFILVLMMMIGIAVVLSFSLDNLKNDFTFLVEHDQPVLSNAHELAKLIVDMETGERGFIITGANNFLEPYHADHKQLEINIAALQARLTDTNDLALLKQIKSFSEQWSKQVAKPEKVFWMQYVFNLTILFRLKLNIVRSNNVKYDVMFMNNLTIWL